MPSAPPDYSEEAQSVFYREAAEVYESTRALTPEQEAIALFWADDPGQTETPPGHSISILTQVLAQEKASLALAAEAYARLGIAVADSFIGCWYAKFQFNLLRPVTYIQSMIDAEWMPPINTPPFPEYTSGHSVQSAASARVLTDLFGEHYAFTDHTHDARGLAARSFSSFAEYAEEAAISRLYGGIHYRAAIDQGMDQGECIGERVSSLQFRID
ncbi:MAG: vanadium-dependent haloperoxidase [Chloroflexi bacterium]|nr:vanadium-dependent haloperoxidase [Chloroflexota bacterium]